MADFSITEYKQAIAGIIGGLVLAFIGVDGYRGVVNPRPDPFTGADGVRLAEEFQFKLEVLDFQIRQDMPPEDTRQRIKAIEHCLEHGCTNFKSMTTEW